MPGRRALLLRAGDPRLQPGSRESAAAGADRLRFAERRLRDAELLVGPRVLQVGFTESRFRVALVNEHHLPV